MNRSKIATICLIIGMFLNPLGFDAVQFILIKLTGSLLYADMLLYLLAFIFFLLYFYFSGNNPIITTQGILL